MNEQAQNELLGYLRETADFAREQAPMVANEILSWEVLAHSVSGAALFALAVFFAWLAFWVKKRVEDPLPLMIVSGLFALIFCGGAIVEACAVAKVYIAPRVVILNHIT